jgi:hypothetical protein
MRKSHYLLTGVALATAGLVILAPAGAVQTEGSSAQASITLTSEQQAEFERWPPEMQTAYSAWPAETQTYYWSLETQKQMIFWRLRDQDKIALTAMTGPERDAAWVQIAEIVAASAEQQAR